MSYDDHVDAARYSTPPGVPKLVIRTRFLVAESARSYGQDVYESSFELGGKECRVRVCLCRYDQRGVSPSYAIEQAVRDAIQRALVFA